MSQSQERLRRKVIEYIQLTALDSANPTSVESFTDGLLQIIFPARTLSLQMEMVSALCDVMEIDPSIGGNGAKVATLASQLLNSKNRYTPAMIRDFYSPGGWYYLNYWKGQQGDLPKVDTIAETVYAAYKGWTATKNSSPKQRNGMLGVDV